VTSLAKRDSQTATGQWDAVHTITIGDVAREHARTFPHEVAVVCGDVRMTFRELDGRVTRAGNLLRSAGSEPGDTVLGLGENCHRLFEVMLAAAKHGLVVCPANWRGTADELGYVMNDVNPRVVLWQGVPARESFEELRRQSPERIWIQYDGDGGDGYESQLRNASSEDDETVVDPASPFLQLYTAAFEGRPNGALLTQLQVIFCNLMQALDNGITRHYVYLSCGPMFHLATLQKLFATFQMAGNNVITARARAEELCRVIQAEHVNGAMIVEPTISQMVELNRDGDYDLSSLRTLPGNPEWSEMTRPDWVPGQSGGYGQTELGGRLCYPDVGLEGGNGRPHSVARVRLLDDAGAEVPDGATGEIAVRGPVVMAGYADRGALNERRYAGDWYRTNDLGRRERDGSITFVGPKARMLKSASENIYPAEVEACIRKHPAVADSALIGVPDPVWGQSAKALVVCQPGASLTAEEVIEFCKQNLASYKKPRIVEFVTDLPKKGGGIDYEALDEQYGGGGYPGGK
jgi:acyl-CoA synthetase (AMP-forming)/AMP-acid ligase II